MQQAEGRAGAARPVDVRVLAAFAGIYFVWGSTFLAIRYAVESIPPFLMIGVRSAIAGALLYGWSRLRGEPRPRPAQWRAAAVGGLCFFVLGHGTLAWAEQRVPSGLAAVVLALIPAWVVLLDWLRPGGVRPGAPVLLGVLLGFAGLVLLVGPEAVAGGASVDAIAAGLLALAALAWAFGSLYSRYRTHGASPVALSGMQLLCGGAILLLAGTATGEWGALLERPITARAIASLGYLIAFGSVLTFSGYIWLLRVRPPARVATYAYVNPVVAVALGWALAGEVLTPRDLLAAAVIVVAVVIIISYQQRRA